MNEVLLQPEIKAIIGLGNPGVKHALTRHNVGFMTVDAIADKAGVTFQLEGNYQSAAFRSKGRRISLLKPCTYMNLSGLAAARICRKRRIEPEEMLIITDDVNIPLGKMRIRKSGSDGGHNGLKSIIEELRSCNFPRIRIGVGMNESGMALEDYVLGNFSQVELIRVKEVIKLSIDLTFKILNIGTNSAVGTYTAALIDEIINNKYKKQ